VRVLPPNASMTDRLEALLHYLKVQHKLSLELYEHGQHPKDIELARFADRLSGIVRTLFPEIGAAPENSRSQE
jgi:hypothetical protein